MFIGVCKNCTNRYIGCHSVCEKYIKEKQQYDLNKAEIRKAKSLNSEYDGYVATQSAIRKKRRNKE